jgi:hypothetical protein
MRLRERLDRIEQLLVVLVQRETVKEWYSIEEAAQILGKAPFTVREWGQAEPGEGREERQRQGCLPGLEDFPWRTATNTA